MEKTGAGIVSDNFADIQRVSNLTSRESLSEKMRATVEELGSSCPDTFDWSIYDQLLAKYASALPRGGVLFKTTFKLVNYHSSCSQCFYAFEIDSYGRGCVHDCSYCYAKDQLTAHGYWNRPQPFPIDLSEVRKTLYTVFETDKPTKWREVLIRRTPLRIGSMSDSFMWMDKRYGITRELLRPLRFYRYPYIIFTRSDLVAHDDYLSVLDTQLASIQMSISGGNEALTKAIEPGAPSVSRRLLALQKLNHHGFWTTVRINPLFPMYPDGFFTDPESMNARFQSKAVPKLELFSWDFIDQIAAAGVPSLLAGFVRLSSASINRMSLALSVDLRSFFRPDYLQINGDKRYSDSEISYYYTKIRTRAAKLGVRFSTCYIGNGEKDFHRFQHLWSNRKDCCDAKGNVKTFSTDSQELPWSTRIKYSPNKSAALKNYAKESQSMVTKDTSDQELGATS